MSRLLILAALVALPAAAAETGFPVRNAADLADLCAGQPPGVSSVAAKAEAVTFCHGFAQGVVSELLHENPKAFCVPKPSPSRTQTMGEYGVWEHAKPERAGEQPAVSLSTFFKERFPCSG